MIRDAVVCALLGTGVVLAGCSQPPAPASQPAAPSPDPTTAMASAPDGMTVTVEVDSLQLVRGQTLSVELRTENRSTEPIEIQAPTGAPYYVHVLRDTAVGWEVIKTYPEMAITVMRRWTLGPGETRRWTVKLPVEPDWPTYQLLRLRAVVNGREDLAPFVYVEVYPEAKK